MSFVQVTREGATAVIAYANPPLGTMVQAGAVEMLAAVEAAVADDTVRAIVLTGGMPGIFIRHYDIGELVALGDLLSAPPPPDAPPGRPGGTFGQVVDAIASAPKPVIAAINGLCMGGGFEIALACDLRIAARAAEAIGLPETRVGIFPGGGGTQRLPRVVGEARALDIILRGRTFTGEEAAAIGLVHEAVDDALARALEIAAEFAGKGVEGVSHAKRLTRSALDRPLDAGIADERASFMEVMRTPGAHAGLRAGLPPNRIERV